MTDHDVPIGAAGRLGRELVRLAHDRVARAPSIPRRVEDLDAAVLTRVLGTPVDEVTPLEATEGTTDRVRLALEGEGLPPSVFVKMAPRAPLVRLFGNLANLGGEEVGFYRHVRPGLAIEAPVVHGLDLDPRTGRFLIVLEDLHARGCSFTDVRTPCPLDRAEAVLATLAALHAAHWRSPRLDDRGPGGLAWVRANGSDPLLPLVARALRRFGRRLAADDPTLAPASGRALLDRYIAVARALDAGPHTVLHGDAHPGNCYFAGETAGLLDWQTIRRGNPLRDVTYFLVLGLDPEVRRRHEHDLLDRYRDALAAAGGPDLDAGAARATYRAMAAYPYAAATFTAGLGGMQSHAIAQVGLRRAALAIDDLDTAATLAPALP
jgi:hypothetical protein